LQSFSFAGINVKDFVLSPFLSFISISATIYFLNRFVNWLFS
jgi:hypothetical protein